MVQTICQDKDWSYTLTSEPALFADRGFTGHEHLTQFGIINMNGRLYDPLVGRFLSPDNYITAPGYTQSYNRYSYCFNNPLRFTDPSGNKPAPFYYDKESGGGGGVYFYIGGDYSGRSNRIDFSGANARADAYFGIDFYTYDWYKEKYYNSHGQVVNWQTAVYGNLYSLGGQIASTYDPTVINSLMNLPPPSPSSGKATTRINDKCGNDFYKLCGNLSSAEKYLKDNASCNKEKFFYINTDGSVLVGPWYDASPGIVSKQYADLFKNGFVVYEQTIYKVEYFVHTHPDDPTPSNPRDLKIYNFFNDWDISTLIYFNSNYYYYDNKLIPIQTIP